MSEQQAPQQQFAVQRLYLKDMSFEAPMGVEVFSKQWKPQMQVELNTRSNQIQSGQHEVILNVTITAKLEDEVAVLIEVQQAGLFSIQGIEGDQLKQVLGIMCPNLLFPYAREAIDNLAMKGGFPALGLQPVNFEALYLQAQQQQAQQEQTSATLVFRVYRLHPPSARWCLFARANHSLTDYFLVIRNSLQLRVDMAGV